MDMDYALQSLSAYENHCFVLSYIEGYAAEEIASRLKITQPAVFKQIEKARKKIKTYMKEAYVMV
jgi:RNA polymerase sigma factor (sigma-70 family)